MNKKIFNVVFGVLFLLPISASYACYPGLDCPDDLPDNTKKHVASTDDWQMVDRYQLKGGLAKAPTTGLMWMRCSFGQTWNGSSCQGNAAEVTWEQAMNISKHFDYSGYSDWRVPTLEELKTLVYCSSGEQEVLENGLSSCTGDYEHPTIVPAAFPETPSAGFWSSSTSTDLGGYAWVVYFYYGYDGKDDKNSNNVVRLVRGGQ